MNLSEHEKLLETYVKNSLSFEDSFTYVSFEVEDWSQPWPPQYAYINIKYPLERAYRTPQFPEWDAIKFVEEKIKLHYRLIEPDFVVTCFGFYPKTGNPPRSLDFNVQIYNFSSMSKVHPSLTGFIYNSWLEEKQERLYLQT